MKMSGLKTTEEPAPADRQTMDFWDRRYADADPGFLFGQAPARFLETHANWFEPGLKLLSVADGEGRNAVWLAQRGLQVCALEKSAVALRKARQFARLQGLAPEFVQVDVLDMEWPQACYDRVLGVFIQFADAAQRKRLFAGMKQALKPGGVLLLHGYTPRQLELATGGPSAVENLYTENMLREDFQDFEILELQTYEAVLAEGRAHCGPSALIDFVARRDVQIDAAG